MLKKTNNKYPNLNLNLSTSVNVKELLKELQNQKTDLVIAIDLDAPSNIIKTPLYTDTYSFYSSKDFKRSKNTPKEMIYLPNSIIKSNWTLQEAIESSELNISPMYNVSTYASVLSLIISGVGIGILPKMAGKFYTSLGIIKEHKGIKIKQNPHKISLYLRQSNLENIRVKSFIEKVLYKL